MLIRQPQESTVVEGGYLELEHVTIVQSTSIQLRKGCVLIDGVLVPSHIAREIREAVDGERIRVSP